MPKILSENGVILTFDGHDVLSNGDIFLHGVITKDTPKSIVQQTHSTKPMSNTPGYQPETPKKSFILPPKPDAPRLGMMCPSCHQSRIIVWSPIIAFPESYQGVFIFNMDNTSFYLMYLNQFPTPIDPEEYRDESGYFQQIIEDIKLSDAIFEAGSKTSYTIQDIAKDFDPQTKGYCPLCNKKHSFQEWINEYAVPTSEFLHTCKFCGGEMVIIAKQDEFNKDGTHQILECEKCKTHQPITIGIK